MVTLAEIARAMNEDPRELKNAGMLEWAINLLSTRMEKIPAGTPAYERYAARLAILLYVRKGV